MSYKLIAACGRGVNTEDVLHYKIKEKESSESTRLPELGFAQMFNMLSELIKNIVRTVMLELAVSVAFYKK